MLSYLARPAVALALVAGTFAADVYALGPIRVPEARAQPRPLDVPYVPTPMEVVEKMLELAKPTATDFLIDLGSGDGRIPVTAAKNFGTPGFGIDLNPQRVKEAKENAEQNKVSDKVTFVEGDLFLQDISKATVLTLYLLPSVNLKLRPTILDKLRPGTRVVSHDFSMDDWQPDRTEKVGYKSVYFWVVPAKVGGTWDIAIGDSKITLDVAQEFQNFKAVATVNGNKSPVSDGRLEGAAISFTVTLPGGPRKLSGRVNGNSIEGDGWKASRRG